MRRAVASILQAFLRTDRDISLRPWGRRCLADHHLRTWCPPNKPPRVSSGSGESWFEPRRGNFEGPPGDRRRPFFVARPRLSPNHLPLASLTRDERDARQREELAIHSEVD